MRYNVTLDAGGHGSLNEGENPKLIDAGSTVYNYTLSAYPKPDTGYQFAGWYFEGDLVVDASHYYTPTGDVTLTAVFALKQYDVTFDSDGGSAVAKQTVEHGSKATMPEIPTRDGYNFDGWFAANSETAFDFDTSITSNVALTAHWTKVVPEEPVTPDTPEQGEDGPFLAAGDKFRVKGQLDLFGADARVKNDFSATLQVHRGKAGLYNEGDGKLTFGMNGVTSLGIDADQSRINAIPVGNVDASAIANGTDQDLYSLLFNAIDAVLAKIGGDTLTINAGDKTGTYTFARNADYENDVITLTGTPSGDLGGVWGYLANSDTIASTTGSESYEFFVAGGSSFQIGDEMRTIPNDVTAPLKDQTGEFDFQKFREPFYGQNISPITKVTENIDKVILTLKAGTALQLGESRAELLRDVTFTVSGLELKSGMVTTLAGNTGDKTLNLISTWTPILDNTDVTIDIDVSEESAEHFVGNNKLRVAGKLDLFGADLIVDQSFNGSLTLYKGSEGFGGSNPTIRIVANGLDKIGSLDKTIDVGNVGISAIQEMAEGTQIDPEDITYGFLYGLLSGLATRIGMQDIKVVYGEKTSIFDLSSTNATDYSSVTITFKGDEVDFGDDWNALFGSGASYPVQMSYAADEAEALSFTLVEGSYIRVGNQTRTLTQSLTDISLLDQYGEVDLAPAKTALMGDIESTVTSGTNDGKIVIELQAGTSVTVGQTTVTLNKPVSVTAEGFGVNDGMITTITKITAGGSGVKTDDIYGLLNLIPDKANTLTFTFEVVEPDPVAKVGELEFNTLEAAIAAAKAGDSKTVTLLKDIDLRSYGYQKFYTFDLSGLTLDLDGHTIKTVNAGVAWSGTNATIQNGKFEAYVPSAPDTLNGDYAIFVRSANGFKLKNLTTEGGVNVFFSSDVELENMDVTGKGYYAVWADQSAEVTVKSGQYKTNSDLAVLNAAATATSLTATGGIFSKTLDNARVATSYQLFDNPDAETKSAYPYMVAQYTEVITEELTEKETEDTSRTTIDEQSGTTTTETFALATSGDETAEPTFAIKTTTTVTQGSGAPKTTESFKPVDAGVVTTVDTESTIEDKIDITKAGSMDTVGAESAIIEAAGRQTGAVTITDGDETNVLKTTAAAKAIAKAAKTVEDTQSISKVEVQLQTKLVGYTLEQKNDAVAATKVIYDVKPVAVVKDDSDAPLGEAMALTNADLEAQNLTMQFKLAVPANLVTASKIVKVTHTGDGYSPEESILPVEGTSDEGYYVTVSVTHFSEFELEAVDETQAACATSSFTLELVDSVVLNWYIHGLTDCSAEACTVYVNHSSRGALSSFYVATTASGDAWYKIPVASMAAKQIGDEISLKLMCGEIEVHTRTYSVKEYCEGVWNGEGNAQKFKNLCKAILTYGSMAQLYFGYNTESLAYGEHHDWVNDLSEVPSSVNCQDIQLNSLFSSLLKTLSLENKTELNFYFQIPEGNSFGEYTFKLGEDVVQPSQIGSTNYYKLTVSGIVAKKLDEAVTVTATKNLDTATIVFSPLSYAANCETNGSSQNLINVCRALYQYNLAAKAYFGQ